MNWFPHKISEGVVIKLLNGVYTAPQNPNWAKYKEKYEIDNLIYGIHEIIREGKKTDNYNYNLCAGPISEEWANAILAKDKEVAIQYKGKWYLALGKSDNTKVKCGIGDIIRTAAEDVNKYETDDPRYPYYKTYVAVVLAPVPEKNVPDKPFVLERLSEFTPRRETFVEKGIKDDIKVSIEEGKIPKEIYERYAKENEPLPKEFYPDYAEGDFWTQLHFRGLDPEDTKKWKKKEISLAKLITGHSMHCDQRMKLGKILVQWVLTEGATEDYINGLKGNVDPKTGNVDKMLCIVKPSGEEPLQKADDEKEIKEALLSEEDAKVISKYIILEKSYIIKAGDVGATSYKDAFMAAICLGKVKAGVQRQDVHEYFLFPEEFREKGILEGRHVIRCFKAGKDRRWWFWKCSDNFLPMDPIEHKAQKDSYYPVPAEEVKQFGREAYK